MTYAHPAARLLLALAFALSAIPALAAEPAALRKPLPPVEGEVIVAFKADAGTLRKHALSARAEASAVRNTLAERASTLGARVGRTLQAGAAVGERVQVMRAAGVDATTLARQLAADPEVAYAVPNGRKRFVAAPNDPLYPATAPGVRPSGPDSGQWYLRAPDSTFKSAIDIEAAWLRTTGSNTVVVAVLDTGVRFEHPDLGRVANGGQLLPGYDMVGDSILAGDGDGRDGDASDPGDFVSQADINADSARAVADRRFIVSNGCPTPSSSSWHGTSTSSLVAAAANNALGMAGAAHGVRVLPVRVLGKCYGKDSDIIAGMRWAAGIQVDGVLDINPNPAKVINMSLGGSGTCSAAYQTVVDEITARGVLIVAAAGNSVGGPVNEPANCRGVVGVLALRHAGTKVGFSDLGAEIAIASPGGNCINTSRGSPCLYPILAATNTGAQGPVASGWTNSFDITVGTSFSSPLVAAVAGLMFSQAPALTPAKVRSALQASARPFPSTGADNGPDDATAVPSCTRLDLTGASGQCYCPNDGRLCGAGMLDAGAGLSAVAAGVVAKIAVLTTAPVAGSSIQLSSTSVPIVDDLIVGQAWTLVDGGGIVSQFDGGLRSAAQASFTATAAGTVRVRLTVTGDRGGQAATEQSIVVGAAPVLPPSTSGGGGGAASWAWVAGVALAAGVLQLLKLLQFKASRRKA